MVVTILKVEPGGCGAENATPARARTSAVRASSAAMPPNLPASAVTAARWSFVSIVVRTVFPGRGVERASSRRPAISWPPGRPARSSSNARSRPDRPTGQSRGKPRSYAVLRSARVRPGSTRPATEAPSVPRLDVRPWAGPCASTLPSRQRMRPRAGVSVVRVSSSSRRRPGKTAVGSQATASSSRGSSSSPRTTPNARVRTSTGRRMAPPRSPRGSRTRTAVAVAVAAAFE